MNGSRPRFTHSEFEIEHQGVRIKILKDGKVILSNEPSKMEDYDEITVSASVIFKANQALKLTKKVEFGGS